MDFISSGSVPIRLGTLSIDSFEDTRYYNLLTYRD
jgi:hypothetical protein